MYNCLEWLYFLDFLSLKSLSFYFLKTFRRKIWDTFTLKSLSKQIFLWAQMCEEKCSLNLINIPFI